MSKLKETKVYNINDFINWSLTGELEISPKYQRNSVWDEKAKSYLIDTIIRGLPVPQIFIRQIIDIKTRKTNREIIDGQQRMRTILSFVNDEFMISKSHNSDYGGLFFSELEHNVQEEFLTYELPVEIIKSKDDSIIYDMFARVNTNNMTLNKQELRNAKYWGEFKVFIYSLSAELRGKFIEFKMFTDKQLSRMADIEFLSSLVIGIIEGVITENPTKIDKIYEKYDECFEERKEVEYKVNRIFSIIEIIIENNFHYTKIFRRKAYFYTLFMALNHMMFGDDNISIDRDERFTNSNIESNITYIQCNLENFESKYERYMNDEIYDNREILKLKQFEATHRSRTTNQTERIQRISFLIEELIK